MKFLVRDSECGPNQYGIYESIGRAKKAAESRALASSGLTFIYELVETIRVERKIKRESHRPPSGIQLEEIS